MNLSTLKPPAGSRKNRKRVGRGSGSGHGGTSGKGAKGQKARSGGNNRAGFEGGQMPMARRLPKRGFRNFFRREIIVVNVDQLNAFTANAVVDVPALIHMGLIKKIADGVKLLGRGEIGYPLTIKLDVVSENARKKIEAAGGSILE
jgi:large subunit ribosomal protein L15